MLRKLNIIILNILRSKTKKRLVLLWTFLLFVATIMMIPFKLVEVKMLPGKNNDSFCIHIDLPEGSSIAQTQSVCQCVSGYIREEKEVTDAEVFLGMGAPLNIAGLVKGSHFKNSENVAEVVVNITKKHDRDEPSYRMVQRLRPAVQHACEPKIPGTTIKFVEAPAGPPTLAAIVAEIYGPDAAGIRKLATKVESIFKSTPGLVDIDIMQDNIYEKVEVQVLNVKIAKSGLNIKQVNDILYLALEGMSIAIKNSSKYNEQVPIFLTLSPETKDFKDRDIKSIKNKLSSLKLMNEKGMMVPLTEVVEIVPVNSRPKITSKNLHQMTNVVAETNMVSQVYPLMEARTTIIDKLSEHYDIGKIGLFNLELTEKESGRIYTLLWDGEMKVTLDTFVDLGGAFIAALILIFLLLVIYYKSFVLSGIILLGSFLSIIGVILGHYIIDLFIDGTFFLTATSLIGFIALIGISSRNSLLLIDFTKSLVVEKGMRPKEAIVYATITRSTPILLTAVAIILASTLLAGDAVFGGLGIALIFGTLAGVISSLMVVPVLMDNSDLERHFHCDENGIRCKDTIGELEEER